MEVILILVLILGWGFVAVGKNEQRIAEIREEYEYELALLLHILYQVKVAIPKTIANEELLEQIELVIDDEDIEEDI